MKEDKRRSMPHTYKKGQSGNPGGRPRSTVLKSFKAKLDELDYDSVKTVVDLARSASSEKVRVEAAGLILAREYPTLKAIEMSGDVGTHFSLNVVKTLESLCEAESEL